MKILLMILTTLIILISIFLVNLNKDIKIRKEKRYAILNPRLKKPQTRSVTFADEIVKTMPVKTPSVIMSKDKTLTPVISPVLVDEYGDDQLLNFDAFVDNYYSQKDITKFKQVYEAEALDIYNRYKLEDFLYKKEEDYFQFR